MNRVIGLSGAFKVALTILFFFPFGALAEGWTLDVRKREEERKAEKWYFSEHLAGKSASNRSDLLYRFFLGKRSPKPRVELSLYGFGSSLQQSIGAGSAYEDAPANGLGYGYGGRLAFNNFLAALLELGGGFPTLNIVPNVRAEVGEQNFEGSPVAGQLTGGGLLTQTVGGGFRLFGQNPEDTALFLDYSRMRLRLPLTNPEWGERRGVLYESWVPDVSAQFYLFRSLALTGGSSVPEDVIKPHEVSELFAMQQWRVGGQLDLAMFRLSYEYSDMQFLSKAQSGEQPAAIDKILQIQHTIRLGFVL